VSTKAKKGTVVPLQAIVEDDASLLEQIGKGLDFKDTLGIARMMRKARYLAPEGMTLLRNQKQFYRHVGTHWCVVDDEVVLAEVYDYIAKAGSTSAAKRATVTATRDALSATVLVDRLPVNSQLIGLANGLLDVGTGALVPHSPAHFTLGCAGFGYDAAAQCPTWLRFIGDVYPDDPETTQLVQEWMGYCLTLDTSQQKMLLMVGPKRSGKGTITRVLRELVGADVCASPTIDGIGSHFGLQSLIDKKVGIVSDARISAKSNNTQPAIENMLRISGEDAITIDRKHIGHWTGTLPTRLMVLTNLLPGLFDEGGALASRFLIAEHRVSFYGREDAGLTATLLDELPGILNWALEGLRRLRARGYFVQPARADEAMLRLEAISSPLKGFLRECCELDPDAWIGKDVLYAAYQCWLASENDRGPTKTKARFAEALYAASDHRVRESKRRDGKDFLRGFAGVKLKGTAPQPRARKF
jgi:P4 family phage/plasmid primase-like protien